MESYDVPDRGLDHDPELILMNGDTFEEHEGSQSGNSAYHTKSDLRSALMPVHLLPSTALITRCFALFGGLARTFIPHSIYRTEPVDLKRKELPPTAYLDGMRGLAAFAVFLCHLSYGTWDTAHVYGAGDKGANNHILQLPIVRLIYAGPPMVAIFFVVSGYALSYKPVNLMRAQQHNDFMKNITSSVFRRALRLFLPCFASTFLVASLCQLGYYKMTEEFAHNMRAISEAHARTEADFISQTLEWGNQMVQFINVFDWSLYAGSTELDPHLWTIPVEYRCSLALFLTLIMTARMSTKTRLSTVAAMTWWGMHWNRWDLIPFWAGLVLAEIEQTETVTTALPINNDTTRTSCLQVQPWKTCLFSSAFVCGLYLASFPDADGHITPGYIYLNSLIPEYWTEKHRFWPTIAAIQIVWSVSRIKHLRNIFTCPSLQYLGRISFPLYLVHGPIIHTFGYMTMDWLYGYTGTENRNHLTVGFIAAASVIIIAVLWAAEVFRRVIDVPSVKFAKWLEGCLFVS